MERLPFELTGPIGARANIGLVVLQTDEIIEQDFRRLFPAGDVAFYTTRIPSGADLSTDSLAAMEAVLAAAAGLLPPAVSFDAIGFGCTSGATIIGPGRVAELVAGAARTSATSDPFTAVVAATAALNVRRIGLISPYVADISAALRAALEARDLEIAAFASFDEMVEARVTRIAAASIRDAALEIGGRPEVEAVFLSCTNLRTLDVIDEIEAALGKPVISSNQALAWHLARLAGIDPVPRGVGRLMRSDRQGEPLAKPAAEVGYGAAPASRP